MILSDGQNNLLFPLFLLLKRTIQATRIPMVKKKKDMEPLNSNLEGGDKNEERTKEPRTVYS